MSTTVTRSSLIGLSGSFTWVSTITALTQTELLSFAGGPVHDGEAVNLTCNHDDTLGVARPGGLRVSSAGVSVSSAAPELGGDARLAVDYRGGHLQIIAAAGSGKTEVVSQRVVSLLEDGVEPSAIVAFTFTERAAASLKTRIEQRAADRIGAEVLDRFNEMFVGTIHSYCFRILQQYVPRYENYDVLDDHRLTAFLTRYDRPIGIRPHVSDGLFKGIGIFGSNVQVIENELIEAKRLKEPFRRVYERYLEILEDHRFLTYGQQIARAVEELRKHHVFQAVHGPLEHLIVDEYQDVNPAQEELIRLLATDPVHLCVVGDDDQSIYQWRGSDVSNIVSFDARYRKVKRFNITKNRRSRPAIVKHANGFGTSIQGRLPKAMGNHRPASGGNEVVCWQADTEQEQARIIAESVRRFHDELGYAYRDIAILCRGRVSFPDILTALQDQHVPVQPGGRTLLFSTPEADLFGRTMCWLVGHKWRSGQFNWGGEDEVDLGDLLARYRALYGLDDRRARRVRQRLLAWKDSVTDASGPANLVRDFYALLNDLGVDEWDLSDPWLVNRLGTLARCSQVLVDYESTKRRSHPDPDDPAKMRGGQDRGEWYYKMLAIYIVNWARGAYEGFEGEENVDLDAVDLTTIHQSKGLEWTIVFVPSLTSRRFPSSMTGTRGDWRVPEKLFSTSRYEGSENDERRLFYVAMTRARDYLSLSTFARIQKAQSPSPFLTAVSGGSLPLLNALPDPPPPENVHNEEPVVELTFSDLAAYAECGLAYRLRRLLGFQPPLVAELGFGKAVHHVMRHVAEFVQAKGHVPDEAELTAILEQEFYLPAANWAGYREMREDARTLVSSYLTNYPHELHKVWEVERPFELHLGEATISGRADVIIDRSDGAADRLEIVDYKTAAQEDGAFDFQLQVYTDAGRREGLAVEGAYVHELKTGVRKPVDVTPPAIAQAEGRVRGLVADLRGRRFDPRPGTRCRRCDVRLLCRHRAD
jgi:DNA helicase-2/ATP-dependent DNA helicase PcrA